MPLGSDSQESIALHVDGESAVAVGDPDAVAALFRKLDIKPNTPVPVGQALADSVAAISGLGAIGTSSGGNWFQMTPESLAKFHELAGHISNGEVFSAVLRGSGGRFNTVIDLVQTSGINPASVANVHALAASMALRMALKNIEDLIQSLGVKLDRLLQDARTKEMGNVQGVTHVLSTTYTAFEKTGKVADSTWDQITDHPTELAQSLFVALGHVETLTVGLSRGSLKERMESARYAAEGEPQHWLMLAALSLANTTRMDTLTIARAKDEEEAESLAEARRAATDELRSKTQETIRKLADAAQELTQVSAFTRVRASLMASKTSEAVERIQLLLQAFSEVLGMPDLSGPSARSGWRKSVVDLAKEVGGGVVTATSAATNGVASFPRLISTAVEDSVLELAGQISSRRESTEGANDDSVTPEIKESSPKGGSSKELNEHQ